MFWNLAFFWGGAVLGAALHWLLIRSERWALAQVLVLARWKPPLQVPHSLPCSARCLPGSDVADSNTAGVQRLRGDTANEGCQPSVWCLGVGWQAQPKWLGHLANVSLLLKVYQLFRTWTCKMALAQPLKMLAVTCLCFSGLFKKTWVLYVSGTSKTIQWGRMGP